MPRYKNPNGEGSPPKRKIIKGRDGVEREVWRSRITDPYTHKQRDITAPTYSECMRKWKEAKKAVANGVYVTPGKITVEKWLQQWHDGRKDTLQPSTYKGYESIIENHINPAIGKMRLADVRRIHLQNMIDKKRKEGCSVGLLGIIKKVIVKALADAVKAELLTVSPAQNLELPPKESKEPTAMDSKLISEFISAAKATPYYRVYMTQLETGCRIGEVLGLRWCDANLTTGELGVNGQLESKSGQPYYKPRTKTGKNRVIYLPPYALQYLKDERVEQNKNRLKAGELWHNDDGLIFTKADGSPLGVSAVRYHFKRIVRGLGHPEMSTHVLRKTYITRELQAGTDVKTIASSVGHSAVDITLRTYAASTEEAKQQAAQRRQERHDKEQ